MRCFICPVTNKDLIWLSVDEYAVTEKEKSIKTILGSCVGIVLFDSKKQIFGMNHFLNVDSGYPLSEKMISDFSARGCVDLKPIKSKIKITVVSFLDNIKDISFIVYQTGLLRKQTPYY